MNFESIFKFKNDEIETKKENVSLNLPLWTKEEEEEEEEPAPKEASKKEEPLKIMDIRPGIVNQVFEKIDTAKFKGLPKFKPFNERISFQMHEKITKDPSFPQISKAFADKIAEKITDDNDVKDTLSWLFQTIRIFNPAKSPDVILNEAKEAEAIGELVRAKLRYMDLAIFALVEGDATQLSSLMQKLHEITKSESEKNLKNPLNEVYIKRFSIVSNQPRETINTVNEHYPKYEEELVRHIEHVR